MKIADSSCDNSINFGPKPPLRTDKTAYGQLRKTFKLAIVSGLFNWPSSGGGNVHTVQLATALQSAGYEVRHLFFQYAPWSIGEVCDSPIKSQAITFHESDWSLAYVKARVNAAVRDFAPDLVLVTDSWSLKPWLAEAISDFPYVLRFDGIECLCPLNNLRIIPHPNRYLEPCTKHRLATPEFCVTCVQDHEVLVGSTHKWEREFSRFDTAHYHQLLLRSLANAIGVLVHNPLIAAVLEPYAANVRVVPIGVDLATFGAVPALETRRAEHQPITRILFAGRTNDLVKGFEVLRAAGERLWQTRRDFRIVATGEQDVPDEPFTIWTGWHGHANMPALLADADIVTTPAIASEPFGLTVVEAMAAGRPIVASRVGGQQFTVIDGLTGLLCEPDNATDLAEKLSILLDSAELRTAMGNAGRRRFLAEYEWKVVIDRYYHPLFEMGTKASSYSVTN